MSKPEVQELKTISTDGSVRYIYFAWLDNKWADLAPYGNRVPEEL